METMSKMSKKTIFSTFIPWLKAGKVNGDLSQDTIEKKNDSADGNLDEPNKQTDQPKDISESIEKEEMGSAALSNPNHRASLILTDENNPWLIIGGSVTGNGHKAESIPCQDSHLIQKWDEGWGVALISDGAGSAKNSHFASSFLVGEAARRSAILVKNENWIEKGTLPEEEEWQKLSKKLFCGIQDSLIGYSKGIKVPFRSMHATLIMIIFSPHGLLVAHVGDGRAGCVDNEDNWMSVIKPFEGAQVGETVFMTLDFENNEHFFESKMIRKPAKAFFLLSDGCEHVCWETLQKDENTGQFFQPNKPFEPFFKQTMSALENISNNGTCDDLKEGWMNYLDSGHKGFQDETDDKTMIIGFLNKK